MCLNAGYFIVKLVVAVFPETGKGYCHTEYGFCYHLLFNIAMENGPCIDYV